VIDSAKTLRKCYIASIAFRAYLHQSLLDSRLSKENVDIVETNVQSGILKTAFPYVIRRGSSLQDGIRKTGLR